MYSHPSAYITGTSISSLPQKCFLWPIFKRCGVIGAILRISQVCRKCCDFYLVLDMNSKCRIILYACCVYKNFVFLVLTFHMVGAILRFRVVTLLWELASPSYICCGHTTRCTSSFSFMCCLADDWSHRSTLPDRSLWATPLSFCIHYRLLLVTTRRLSVVRIPPPRHVEIGTVSLPASSLNFPP